jgi:hypothetical protein
MSTHYADSFTLIPGRCFRMATDPEPRRRGQPAHCDEPVVWRGRFRNRGEDTYRVNACESHADELTYRKRITYPLTDRGEPFSGDPLTEAREKSTGDR